MIRMPDTLLTPPFFIEWDLSRDKDGWVLGVRNFAEPLAYNRDCVFRSVSILDIYEMGHRHISQCMAEFYAASADRKREVVERLGG